MDSDITEVKLAKRWGTGLKVGTSRVFRERSKDNRCDLLQLRELSNRIML